MCALTSQAPSHIWTMRLKGDWFQILSAHARRAPLGTGGRFQMCLPLITAHSTGSSLSSWVGALEETSTGRYGP